MSLEVKQFHNCQKPDMETGKVKTWTERTGSFWRKENHTRKLYDDREARWTCPECDSTWRYSASFDGYEGTWFAVVRTSHWVEIDKP